MDRYPKRIVCVTEETTETVYMPGEQDRIIENWHGAQL